MRSRVSTRRFRCLRFVDFVTFINVRLATWWDRFPLSRQDFHLQDKPSFAWHTERFTFITTLFAISRLPTRLRINQRVIKFYAMGTLMGALFRTPLYYITLDVDFPLLSSSIASLAVSKQR